MYACLGLKDCVYICVCMCVCVCALGKEKKKEKKKRISRCINLANPWHGKPEYSMYNNILAPFAFRLLRHPHAHLPDADVVRSSSSYSGV